MILKIGSKRIKRFDAVNIELRYDSVASTFAFSYYFDPNDSELPELSDLGAYKTVTIEDDKGNLLLTGTVLNHGFIDESAKGLTSISGYSLPGVLEDSSIPISAYPLQSDGKTLAQIVSRLLQPFGIEYVISESVSAAANKVISVTTAEAGQTVKAYLSEICAQRNIILSHDNKGRLLLTRANEGAAVSYSLVSSSATRWSLNFDGRGLHSDITVIKQASSDGGNAGQSSVKNPYVRGTFRPLVKVQTSGDDIDTASAARSVLGDELRAVSVGFELSSWYIDDQIITANTTVSILNPEIGLKRKTKFFIESVRFTGNTLAQTSAVSCVLPEVHSSGSVKNVFL